MQVTRVQRVGAPQIFLLMQLIIILSIPFYSWRTTLKSCYVPIMPCMHVFLLVTEKKKIDYSCLFTDSMLHDRLLNWESLGRVSERNLFPLVSLLLCVHSLIDGIQFLCLDCSERSLFWKKVVPIWSLFLKKVVPFWSLLGTFFLWDQT